jgi:hypothetical protein
MKKMCFFILLAAISQGMVFADLTLIQPHGGEVLVMGAAYPIKWTAPASEGEQQVTIFLGDKIIADHSKKKDGSYNWVVGRLKNGSYVPPGHYKIVLESLDGDAFGKEFTIIAMTPLLSKIHKLEIYPLPDDCPMCYRLDLREIKTIIKTKRSKERFHLKLYRGNRPAADLGPVGGGRFLPDFAKIKIPMDKRPMIRKSRGFKYELKLFDSRGKLLETQKVLLVIKNQK